MVNRRTTTSNGTTDHTRYLLVATIFSHLVLFRISEQTLVTLNSTRFIGWGSRTAYHTMDRPETASCIDGQHVCVMSQRSVHRLKSESRNNAPKIIIAGFASWINLTDIINLPVREYRQSLSVVIERWGNFFRSRIYGRLSDEYEYSPSRLAIFGRSRLPLYFFRIKARILDPISLAL